jgi:sigma-70-like protein
MPTRHADPITDCGTLPAPTKLMLQCLPAQHREIVVATYFRGLTTLEAAAMLGLTPAAAKDRLYHAMRDLSLMASISRPDHPGPYPGSARAAAAPSLPRHRRVSG